MVGVGVHRTSGHTPLALWNHRASSGKGSLEPSRCKVMHAADPQQKQTAAKLVAPERGQNVPLRGRCALTGPTLLVHLVVLCRE